MPIDHDVVHADTSPFSDGGKANSLESRSAILVCKAPLLVVKTALTPGCPYMQLPKAHNAVQTIQAYLGCVPEEGVGEGVQLSGMLRTV